jgi:hypothetical protein
MAPLLTLLTQNKGTKAYILQTYDKFIIVVNSIMYPFHDDGVVHSRLLATIEEILLDADAYLSVDIDYFSENDEFLVYHVRPEF